MLLRCFGASYQWEIITSTARFLGVFMGRRVGKTFCCYQRASYKCLDRAGFRYAYICQNNALAEKVYLALANNPALKPFILKPVNRAPFKIIFKNGSYIEFWNYDKIDKIRGNEYDEVWLDEVQDFPEDKFGSVIRPLVSSTNGNIVISGQFRGEACWYYKDFFVQGQSKYMLAADGVTPILGEDGKPVENILYRSWRIPSSQGLCFQGKMGRAELAEMKRTLLQAQWDIECECIARASLSAAFDQNQIRACIRGDNRTEVEWEAPVRGMAYVIGLDLGHTHDPSAYVILEVTTGRIVKVHQFPLRTKAEDIAHEVNLMAMKYNGADVVMDVTGQKGAAGGEHGDRRVQIITEAVTTRVHHEHINHPSKKHEYVKNLDIELANNKLTIRPTERLLIQEMQAFEYRNVGHYVQYGSPKSQTSIHDDTVMALCLALWGKRMGWYDIGKKQGFNPYNM